MMQYKTNIRTNTLNPGIIEHNIATITAPTSKSINILI